MEDFTERGDWVNDYLASSANFIVSGHPSFVKKIGIKQIRSAEVRFAANRSNVYLYMFTIEASVDSWERIENLLTQDEQIKQFFGLLERVLPKADSITLLYDNDSPNIFSLTENMSMFKHFDKDGLQEKFRNIDYNLTRNPGVVKNISETLNDSFQSWTREYLSGYLTINDFDAIKFGEDRALYELKRVEEQVENWAPYVDDETNYASLLKIANNRSIDVRTISYQVPERNNVGYHYIEETTKKDTRECEGDITGQRYICDVEETTQKFPVDERNRGVERYRSKIFREPRRCDDGYEIIGW